MRFPSWQEFTAKYQKFEKSIEEFKTKHPEINDLVQSTMNLPSPFDQIALEIYNKYDGSHEEKLDEVTKYLNAIGERGESQYNKVTQKLDDVTTELSHIKQITSVDSLAVTQYDSTTQEYIQIIEQNMEKQFNLWKFVYPKKDASPDPMVNAKTEAQLKEITNEMCNELKKLQNFFEENGIKPNKKYPAIVDICKNSMPDSI